MIPSRINSNRYSVPPSSNIPGTPQASEGSHASSSPPSAQHYVNQYVQKVLQEGRFSGFPESRDEYVQNQVGAHVYTEQYAHKARTGIDLADAEVARIKAEVTASSTTYWNDSAAKKAAELATTEYAQKYPRQQSPMAFMPGSRHTANALRAHIPEGTQAQGSRSDSALPSDAAIAAAVMRRVDRGDVFFRARWRDTVTGKRMETSRTANLRGEDAARKLVEDHLREVLRSRAGRLLGT